MVQKILKAIHAPAWLVVVLSLQFVLRIPSFFDPYSYGDEMIYLTLGNAIRKGLVLYRDIHDNKPPLLYFTAAIAGDLFWFRVILAFWMMATTFIFWKLTSALFKKQKMAIFATVIFAILTTLPLLEGQIANAELFMIGPNILAFLILLTKKHSIKNLLLAGVLFSVATLFKVPAAFDILAIIFFWFVIAKFKKENVFQIIKDTFVLAIGYLTPIIATFAWYFSRGAFDSYLVAAYLQNFGYLSSFRPGEASQPFLIKNGPLLVRAGITAGGLFILYMFRKKLSKTFIFASGWLLVGLFAITLSERPYPHYLIQIVPALSILIAILVLSKTMEQVLAIFPILLLFGAIVFYRFWYYPTASYYLRFVNFATHRMDRDTFYNSFDGRVNRNYDIAKFLISSTSPDDKVFIWGDSSSVIYALSKRLPPIKYAADYHINDFSSKDEVLVKLYKNMPKMIVMLPEGGDFPNINSLLTKNYFLVATIENAQIWDLAQLNSK